MKSNFLLIIGGLCLLAAAGLASAIEPAAGLDGAVGNVFKVNPEAKSFELLKETEYDPKTDIGKSRFTIHWDDGTAITRVEEVKSFDGIGGPVVTDFHGIDKANVKALSEGKPFVARVAVIHSGAGDEMVCGIAEGGGAITGWFTPVAGESRGGTVEVNGKAVPVSLRDRNWRIFHHQPVKPEELTRGFWKATLHGAEKDGRFVVDEMEVSALPDPRESDDPSLPRVLVIGDSISMNYHEAAKAALKGVANYHRNEGNSFSSVHGVSNAELWLGNYETEGFHWDVIQFNHGLHDLKQTYDQATDSFGDYAVSLEQYQQSLEKEIRILKKTGAQLIWCSTTPVQKDMKTQYARRKGAAEVFNKAALEVIQRHPEILINDLHAVVTGSPVFDDWRTKSDVHFYKEEEQKLLGDAVANAVRKALARDSTRPDGAVQLVGDQGYSLVPDGDGPCKWTFENGVLTASPVWDSVVTRDSYQDFRMHVEFNVNQNDEAKDPEGDGNSGIYIQKRYEIQILNSFGVPAEDYKASYCGSIYKLKKPDQIVCRKAGEWQSYDIVFRAARFEGDKKTEDARITVHHNGVLIHDDFPIPRKTGVGEKEGPEPGPIKLQGHHNPVRFRNVWIQRLSLD